MDGDQESSFNFTAIGATVSVTRNRAASPRVNGTFDITFGDKTIRGMCKVLLRGLIPTSLMS